MYLNVVLILQLARWQCDGRPFAHLLWVNRWFLKIPHSPEFVCFTPKQLTKMKCFLIISISDRPSQNHKMHRISKLPIFSLWISSFYTPATWVIFSFKLQPYSFYIIQRDDKKHTQIRSYEYLHHISSLFHSGYIGISVWFFIKSNRLSFALIWYKLEEKKTHTHTRAQRMNAYAYRWDKII